MKQKILDSYFFVKKNIKIYKYKNGFTNNNFLVELEGSKYFVRVCADVSSHYILRENEIIVSKFIMRLKVGPSLIFSDKNIMVFEFVDIKKYNKFDCNKNIIKNMKKYHDVDVRSTFIPCYDIIDILVRYSRDLNDIINRDLFEEFIYKIESVIYIKDKALCHNDLLIDNILCDSNKCYFVDWEYCGVNFKLFDLANYLSNSNTDINLGLTYYFKRKPNKEEIKTIILMEILSLIRKLFWCVVELKIKKSNNNEIYKLFYETKIKLNKKIYENHKLIDFEFYF